MSAQPAPSLRRWTAVLLAVACVALLPVLLALLAPPTLLGQGPALGSATHDCCSAALDRVERLLAGALDVELLGPTFTGLATPPASCGRCAHEAQPAPRLALAARPSETERTL